MRALLERVPGREALDALQAARWAQATVPKPFRIPAPIGAIEDDLPTCG